MSAQHTPGPWEDGRSSDSIVWKGYEPKDALAESLIEWYGGQLIAESIAPHNKPLIKASPLMLTTLRDVYERLCQDDNYVGDPLLAQVYAAIAVAKGNTP